MTATTACALCGVWEGQEHRLTCPVPMYTTQKARLLLAEAGIAADDVSAVEYATEATRRAREKTGGAITTVTYSEALHALIAERTYWWPWSELVA